MFPLSFFYTAAILNTSAHLQGADVSPYLPLEMISKEGYVGELHEVVTEDGYVLGLHRIKAAQQRAALPVLLVHGLLAASDSWLQKGRGDSLAYLLSDAGFDVWLGNVRGNCYSKKHIKYSPKQIKFWNFSYQEHGEHDIPAMVDLILAVTGAPQLHYIGYSMGTTAATVSFNSQPSFASKIASASLLAPVMYSNGVRYSNTAINQTLEVRNLILKWSKALKIYELFPRNKYLTKLVSSYCDRRSVFIGFCLGMADSFYGTNRDNIDLNNFGKHLSSLLSGTSFKVLHHYSQLFASGVMKRFDYERDNFRRYGRSSPPQYQLDRISVPVFLYYGDRDILMTKKNIEYISRAIPSEVKVREILGFTHWDFLFGITARSNLYDVLIQDLIDISSNQLGSTFI